jgi:hypothetical protein
MGSAFTGAKIQEFRDSSYANDLISESFNSSIP